MKNLIHGFLMPKEGTPWQKFICPKSRTFMPLEEYTIAESPVGVQQDFPVDRYPSH